MTVWRMSMRFGNGGYEMWPQCRDRGVAAIGYGGFEDIDLSQHKKGEPAKRWAALASNAKRGFLSRVAYDMKRGDTIYVKQGTSIVGRGRVTGAYRFDRRGQIVNPDSPELPFAHQVPVKWEKDFPAVPIKLGAEPSTVLELKGERLRTLERAIKKAPQTNESEPLRGQSGRIPTVRQYKVAFLAIRERMHPKHLAMLRANYISPNHTISVKGLAKAVGYEIAHGVYGKLGRLLCDELRFRPTMKTRAGTPVLTSVFADSPSARSDSSWEWTLRPQVVQALEELGWVNESGSRRAYILTWNPSNWTWDERTYANEVRQTALGKLVPSRWSSGNTKKIEPGDRLFLMRQGFQRGLIGTGVATSRCFPAAHWSETGMRSLYVEYLADTLLNVDDRLPVEELLSHDLGVSWNNLYASGIRVPDEFVQRLERLWEVHLLRIGRSVVNAGFDTSEFSDEVPIGATDEVNRVLRSIKQRQGQPVFRERLIVAYGGRCAVTGCDAKAALEAAHIEPYVGPQSNSVSNGLLLRSDIHTLFDLGLLAVVPRRLEIRIARELQGTDYEKLNGLKLRLPTAARCRPSDRAIALRWASFHSCQVSIRTN